MSAGPMVYGIVAQALRYMPPENCADIASFAWGVDEGWSCDEVDHEKWNPHAQIRQDLFQCIDVLALGPDGVMAVQCTSASNLASRVNKIADAPALPFMREAGWRIECWGWKKNKSNRWEVRKVDVS